MIVYKDNIIGELGCGAYLQHIVVERPRSFVEYLLFKYAHVIAFVYWLGGDLGTFFGSKYVAKPELSPQTRAIALKIMLACDQGPKIAMPLIFPFGLQMASQLGVVNISASLLIAIWLIAAVWVVNVRYMYTTDNQAAKAK
ncbi:hypothetical protein LCGC14_2129660, partial [marine sediment metagenome]